MSLKKYQEKRNFNRTTEPSGNNVKTSKNKTPIFVVQKHAASHLHYDFRLEMQGVLKSWAVPKGPCLDPKVKRLAVQVEDHPLAYGSFEGSIPQGEYGAGTVMMWDQGHWHALPDSNFKKGDLKFVLKGKKLKGQWKLIQIKKDPKNWLLIKTNDEEAFPESEYDITQEKALSVISKRTMEEIAHQASSVKQKKTRKTQDDVFAKNPINKGKNQTHSKAVLTQTTQTVLTHPERILYPTLRLTKLDLAVYYEKIHHLILPYIKLRPLSLVRCPQGNQGECFYQKHVTEKNAQAQGFFTIDIQEKEKTRQYIYIKDLMGLLKIVQMNVLEIHPWGARIDKIERPDVMIFDLDPAQDVPWEKVVAAALEIKAELEDFALISFLKTTGGKGLHIVVPIQRRYSWEQVKGFAKQFVDYMVAKHPSHYVGTATKVKREGKIFLDYLRNGRGATAVAPYSTRANEKATIAVPLGWHELSEKLHSDAFSLVNIEKRLAKLSRDPWEGYFKIKQGIPQLKF